MSKRTLGDMKTGDVFKYAYRVCTLENYKRNNRNEIRLYSLNDGWEYLLSWCEKPTSSVQLSDEVEEINMPETPLELINFIREHQYHYDD